MEMKEFHVTLKVRNNRLLQRRKQAGMTQGELCEQAGVEIGKYVKLEGIGLLPLVVAWDAVGICVIPFCDEKAGRFGGCKEHRRDPERKKVVKELMEAGALPMKWSKTARKLAEFWAVEEGDLFPDAVLKLRKGRGETLMSAAELDRLALQDNPTLKQLDAADMSRTVIETLDALTPRERGIIERRYGLDGHEEHTLDQLSHEYEVTRERIRQLERRALGKMRYKDKFSGHELRAYSQLGPKGSPGRP